MIGAGQHILLELWHGGRLVHRGILPPGEDTVQRFVNGPESVGSFVLRRLTKSEADALSTDFQTDASP